VLSVACQPLGFGALPEFVEFSATVGLEFLNLSQELLLLKGNTFLLYLKLFKSLAILSGSISELLLPSLEICSLELELLVNREKGAEVTVEPLDFQNCFPVLLSNIGVQGLKLLYTHALISISFL
jgi:hypothetical protein